LNSDIQCFLWVGIQFGTLELATLTHTAYQPLALESRPQGYSDILYWH
jgi:hypothetical protein